MQLMGRQRRGMKRYLAVVVVIAVASGAAVAEERRYLVPIDGKLSILDAAPGLHAYHLAVRDALVGTGGNRTWEAVVIPSFKREWAVYAEKDARSNSQTLVCAVMQTQLWYQMERGAEQGSAESYARKELMALQQADKKISRFAAPIATTTATALERLWSAMLSQGKPPAEPPRCLDGTNYLLSEWTGGVRGRGGWGRCPQKGTPPAAALSVLEELCTGAFASEIGVWPDEERVARDIAQVQGNLK
jgi:hypothetical protein